MGKFRDYIVERIAPPWLTGEKGAAWHSAIGDVMDSCETRVREAIRARFPRLAGPDSLARTGAERGIERGPGESLAAYAERVVKARDAWRWCGTPFGVLTALRHAGFTTARMESVRGKDHSLDGNGALVEAALPSGSWAIEATPAFWSKFIVLFPAPHPWAAPAGVDFVGTGDLTMIAGGKPDAVHTVQIDVTTGGALGSAFVTVTIDDEATPDVKIPASGIVALDDACALKTGIVVQFSAGKPDAAAVIGDQWKFDSGVFPTDDSETVQTLRRLIRRWKGTHATCSGIVVVTSGWILGWPPVTLAERGLLGDCERVIWSV